MSVGRQRMQPSLVNFLFLALCLVFASREALASTGIDFEASVAHYGKYIWRGQNLNDDVVFQAAVSASYGGLTAGIWGNLDVTNINGNSGDFSELDYWLGYSAAVAWTEALKYSLGVIHYDFPGTPSADTTEVYWGLEFDLPLSPSVTVYHDVDEADGTYVSLGIGHRFEKIAELTPELPVGIEIGASLGYASASYDNYYWGTDQSKVNDLALSVAFPVSLGNWTLRPSLNYVTLLSDDIRDSDAYGTDSDFFLVGIGLSTSF